MNRSATQLGGTAAVGVPDAHRGERAFDLSIAGRCTPAGRGGQPIAGDFYDAYVLDGHRCLITIGDVAGHGYGAGSRMRRLRAGVRLLAHRTPSPADLLAALDQPGNLGGDDDIATVWIGIYDKDTGLLVYASAGHPPPVIAATGCRPRLLAAASAPPLGTGAVAAHVRAEEVHWPVGALLVAYSDGLVERPQRDLEEQIHALREIVGAAHAALAVDAAPGMLAERLLNALVPDPASTVDDVCILVLRREVA